MKTTRPSSPLFLIYSVLEYFCFNFLGIPYVYIVSEDSISRSVSEFDMLVTVNAISKACSSED